MIGVREYLENLGHSVSYDQDSGDVLVDNERGKMKSIGSSGFTLKDDGKYYAESEQDILNALTKSGISHKNGYSPLRNSLSKNNTVGYNDKTGQVYINGRDYNVDGDALIKIGSQVYGRNDFIKSINEGEYKNDYRDLEERVLTTLLNERYTGYNPESDPYYQKAHKDFVKDAKADMGKRGIVSDSLAAHYAAQGAEKLLPLYAEMNYEKYRSEKEDLKDALDSMMALDESDRASFKANRESALENVKLSHQREEALAEQKHKAAELSDKEKEREAEMAAAEFKAKNEREMMEREYALRLGEAEAKAQMEKEIARLQSDLDISKAQATAYYKALYK